MSLSSEDVAKVDSVMEFWFGGDQQSNYHTKWFPEGSSEIQANADRAINSLFGNYLDDAMNNKLNHWECGKKSCVALILILDQFSRHIFRLKNLPSGASERAQADSIALTIAKRFHSNASMVANLPMAEYVFSLMPLRHTATIDHLTFILNNLKDKEVYESQSTDLLAKFRKQTVRRLQHLQDREKLEATDDILERSAFSADETDILSNKLVKTTESFLLKHLYGITTVESTVKKGNGKSGNKGNKGGGKSKGDNSQINDNNVKVSHAETETQSSGENKQDGKTLFISLSGGVDSMVLSKILKLLLQSSTSRLNLKRIVGIHIDYANRPESGREAAYVQSWCEELGIDFKVRTINEVTRGITSRDEYEKVARDIRYAFYQECIQEVVLNEQEQQKGVEGDSGVLQLHGVSHPHSHPQISGIMFGHHIGDVQENVISNVMRGSSPLYLSGMTESSLSNNVLVWRPLLSHTKEEIYEFAHRYGVPYFKDSTPSWSTRGKLRNQLIPLLTEMYGAGCLRNLSALAMESDQVRELVEENIYKPLLDSVQRYPCGLKVPLLPFRTQPLCFWKEVLKLLMHSMGMCMIRDKAVQNFVERLQKVGTVETSCDKISCILPGWLELRKGFYTLITDDNQLVILKDGVLRSDLIVLNSTTANQMKQKGKALVSEHKQGENEDTKNDTSTQPFRIRTTYTTTLIDTSIFSSLQDKVYTSSISVVYSQQALNEINRVQYGMKDANKKDNEDGEVNIIAMSGAVGSGICHVQIGSWLITIDRGETLHTLTEKLSVNDTNVESVTPSHSTSISTATSMTCTSHRNMKKQQNKLLGADKLKLLTHFEEILCGSFTYSINMSNDSVDLMLLTECDLFNWKQDMTLNPLTLVNVDMRTIESRLRDGLPLLVPTIGTLPITTLGKHDSEGMDTVVGKGKEGKVLKLTYQYVVPKNG